MLAALCDLLTPCTRSPSAIHSITRLISLPTFSSISRRPHSPGVGQKTGLLCESSSLCLRLFRQLTTSHQLFSSAGESDQRDIGPADDRMRVLNVAEKNDAAKNISNILSKGSAQRQNGLSIYNKVFQFRCDVPQIGNAVYMTMTSVSGHMLNYDFTGTYASWSGCDPADLFQAPVTRKVAMPDVQKNLLHYARDADFLIIWTDCDREGENIGFEVIEVVRSVRPQIRVFRAKFSEITGRSIFSAVSNLIEPDERASKAVDVRQELDLRIGAAFTRFQTMYMQRHNLPLPVDPVTRKSVVSYGSCQFPTLGFVVERYKEREEFVSQPFWFLEMQVSILYIRNVICVL